MAPRIGFSRYPFVALGPLTLTTAMAIAAAWRSHTLGLELYFLILGPCGVMQGSCVRSETPSDQPGLTRGGAVVQNKGDFKPPEWGRRTRPPENKLGQPLPLDVLLPLRGSGIRGTCPTRAVLHLPYEGYGRLSKA